MEAKLTTQISQKSMIHLLSRADAAAYLGVSKGTLEVWASTQRYALPFVKVGRLAKYRLADLDAFIESRLTDKKEGVQK